MQNSQDSSLQHGGHGASLCLWTKDPDPGDPERPDSDPQHYETGNVNINCRTICLVGCFLYGYTLY